MTRTLILGEIRSGKTLLTAKLAAVKASEIGWENVTIIDIAPTDVPGIGGRITRFLRLGNARLLTPEKVFAPRLMGRTPDERWRMAESNRRSIEPLLLSYIEDPTPMLVLNDASIYLHAGDLSTLLRCIDESEIFVGNAYYGAALQVGQGDEISSRERELVRRLAMYMDHVIYLCDP